MTQDSPLKCISLGHDIRIPEFFNIKMIYDEVEIFQNIGFGFKEKTSILPKLIKETK